MRRHRHPGAVTGPGAKRAGCPGHHCSPALLPLGMVQLPPAMVSAPFKILLFVLVDGWNLVVGSLMKSFYA